MEKRKFKDTWDYSMMKKSNPEMDDECACILAIERRREEALPYSQKG